MSILSTLVLAVAPLAAGDGDWLELQLDNGIRATIITAESAESQATFTFVPLGLLDDDAGCTQFAHLIEHLAVRSTDPDDLSPQDLLINGETMALTMRLETMAPVDAWRTALKRHARWLTTSEVDPVVLEREKRRIATEEQSTASYGFTHKWALAAWNQVVRHGAQDVRLTGDVAAVTPAQALEYLKARLRPGPGVHVVTVGPVPADDMLPFIQETLGSLPNRRLPTSTPSVGAAQVREPGPREATWDLQGAHYLEWYPVPAETPADLVAADALALLLNVRFQQHGSLQGVGVQALAAADLVTPEGRWLLVTASLPTGVDREAALGTIRKLVDEVLPIPEAPILISQMAQQLVWPDFAELREQFAGQPQLRLIEAQQTLFHFYAQLNTGLERDELVAAYAAFTAEELSLFAEQVLVEDLRSTLLLTPIDGG